MRDTGVAGLDLRLRRRSVYGYTIGLGAYALVIVALYPSFQSDTSLDQLLADDPTMAALFGVSGSLTSPTGWLNANLYANFVPLIVLLITVGYGASCLAGQDEDGTLALVATLPVSRRRVVLQKAAALTALSLPAAVATMACVLVGRGFDLDVSVSALAGITVGVLLLGVDFGAVAMLIGAATGSRGTALGVTSAVAAAAYLISSLAPVVHWLHPARFASPFFYAVGDNQLDHGLSFAWLGVLAGIALAAVAATITAFERLDLH
ncbi:ABC transporter permease [Nocardia sp. MDA0666]|uniref:ABC transporter permease subunit n=1 Tax=Nocardia sp. MDA0666 TaxID=2135448 RepID=UPI000D120E4B|nr:ABC transporter permease subunit [Nocardia sp. MDA0666]PSR58651.1 ABC transporter permease [Nocardia sp. MDA0666]